MCIRRLPSVDRLQAAQAAGTAAAYQVHQYRFYIIVGRMSDSDAPGADFAGCVNQEIITYFTRSFFAGKSVFFPVGFYIARFDYSRYFQAFRKRGYVFRVRVRLVTTEPVVKMGGMDLDTEFITELFHYMQQANGVRTSGNRYNNLLPDFNQ
jgi:hypothetical protein